MAKMSEGERLKRVSQLIGSERHPYYVRHPVPIGLRSTFPSEGWYWIPPGEQEAKFLARDAFDGYHRLMLVLEEQSAVEEAAAA